MSIREQIQRLGARFRSTPGPVVKPAPGNPSITAEFERLGPWITQFEFGGERYGGWYDAAADPRLDLFRGHFSGVRTILELGSLEGGHTVTLGREPGVERVVGIEGRPANLARARLIQELTHSGRTELLHGDLETMALDELGGFDVVFCVGLLYHLPRPWELLSRLPAVAPSLFLSSHYALDEKATMTANGYHGMPYQEFGFEDPLSGLSPESFWPTRAELVRMLGDCGYPDVTVLEDDPNYRNGALLNLAAHTRA